MLPHSELMMIKGSSNKISEKILDPSARSFINQEQSENEKHSILDLENEIEILKQL